MLFSSRHAPAFLPGWLSLVRPRKGSQSAGLIIWFERSGGRGFDRRPLSITPGIFFSFSWTISGRRRLRKKTSAIRLPLSVITGPTLPAASLRTVFSEIFLIFATVDE